jgi:DNA (cytosine-5)-methyltransferase 3A
MKILSLFDGISCGMVALEKLGIEVIEYNAFEIEENAIKISKKNYPNIKRYGNVLEADFSQFKDIDLLLGGSPCQDLSISKSKDREGLKGSKSSLFWSYKDALDIVKPKYFLFENVASMKDADKDIITEALGVEPIYINSCDFVAQNRERYYWTNIPVAEVKAASHKFREVMEEEVDNKFYYNKPFILEEDKTKNVIGTIQLNTYEANKRVFNPDGVIGCLTCVSGGYQEKKVYDEKLNKVRKLTPIEYERLQGLPDNYTSGISNSKRYTVCGNGWTVDVIAHILKGIDNGHSN